LVCPQSTQVRWCSSRSVGAKRASPLGRWRQRTSPRCCSWRRWRYTVASPMAPSPARSRAWSSWPESSSSACRNTASRCSCRAGNTGGGVEGGVIAAERCGARREVARAGERWREVARAGEGGGCRLVVQGAEVGRWFGAMGQRDVTGRWCEEVGLRDGAELWDRAVVWSGGTESWD